MTVAISSDFQPGQRVDYVEVDGTYERGTVLRIDSKYVFVRFDKKVNKWGRDYGATSQCCNPNDLRTVKTSVT